MHLNEYKTRGVELPAAWTDPSGYMRYADFMGVRGHLLVPVEYDLHGSLEEMERAGPDSCVEPAVRKIIEIEADTASCSSTGAVTLRAVLADSRVKGRIKKLIIKAGFALQQHEDQYGYVEQDMGSPPVQWLKGLAKNHGGVVPMNQGVLDFFQGKLMGGDTRRFNIVKPFLRGQPEFVFNWKVQEDTLGDFEGDVIVLVFKDDVSLVGGWKAFMAMARKAFKSCRSLRIVVLPNLAHMAPVTDPEQVAIAVDNMLTDWNLPSLDAKAANDMSQSDPDAASAA